LKAAGAFDNETWQGEEDTFLLLFYQGAFVRPLALAMGI